MKPSAERGGVSRPSSRPWTTTSVTPASRASSAMATAWRSTLWTPPGPMSPTRCRREPRSATERTAASSAAFWRKVPSAISASMRGRSWSTGRPAPMLRCPTSLLPICPSGSPTAAPEASSRLCGQSPSSARQRGMSAAAMASTAGSGPMPKPSMTTRTMGHGRAARVVTAGISLFKIARRRGRPPGRAPGRAVRRQAGR